MPSPRAPKLAPGASVQHYEVIRRLGQGGMGTVYLARDKRLGRLVALKLLTRHTGEHAARFLREAQVTAQLGHENIVVIHELGEHEGTPYMVLEYLQGKTLEQMLRERREQEPDDADPEEPPETTAAGLPKGRAVALMIPVLRALAWAHERGVVHRDLKPSNIFWTDAGIVKVLDFGLAEDLAAKEGSAFAEPATAQGSMAYMAPEQWRGDRVDHRTDLWAAGLVLAELVLGRHPLAPLSLFAAASVPRLDVPMPSLRELCPDLGKLGAIVDRCLKKRVEERAPSALDLCAELEALAPATRSSPPRDEERNPFVGLEAFQPADAGRFFGRAASVALVVARLAEQPLLAVVAPSGAGKSSFVRAGVIPALERGGEEWESFVLRPGGHPLAALAALLPADPQEASGREEEERGALAARLVAEPGLLGARLRAGARRRRRHALLFVDQLEELFTLAPEEERGAFLACLAGAADEARSPVRVVLAIRSDFLDRLAAERAALPKLDHAILLLPPMDRDGLREALSRPLEAVDHAFEPPALVEEMLDALASTAAALPLLSFTAARLWEQRDRARRALTEASYRRLGGLGGALSGHADAVLGAMSAEERALARAALLRLVTPERTRARAAMRELSDLGPRAADMRRVLGRLVDARLLSIEGSGEAEVTVELVHESLIVAWPALAAWLSENQEDAAFVARLGDAARAWEAGGRSDDLLWRGQVLEGARLWRARFAGELAQGEERFLQASTRLYARARGLRRRITVGAFVAVSSIAVGVSLLAVSARRAAVREREEAALAVAQAERADEEAARAQDEARQARNATRMAAAREQVGDPTTVLAILREAEPPGVPRGWAQLARWALGAGVARGVFFHPDVILSAAWSPDGKRIVAASWDKTARIWNADGTGEPLVLRGHTDAVYAAAWSPDGQRIVTASLDKTARVWNADGTGEPLVLRGHQGGVTSAAWSPDGRRIVTASLDKTARVWSADGTGPLLVLRGHEEPLAKAAWSPDGKRIVTASNDKTARVWSADGTGVPLVLRGHEARIHSAAWSPDGQRIVTASWDKTARVWSADGTGRPLVLRGHQDEVHSAAFGPDGQRIVTASVDRTVRVWSADGTGVPLVLRGHQGEVHSAAFGPDGEHIVTASGDHTVRVWSADATGVPLVLRGHELGVESAVWSPDGQRIATASWDKTARVWSADGTGRPLVLRGHEGGVTSAAWSPDGKHLVTASDDRTARVWNADGTGVPLVLRGHEQGVDTAAWSPDGKHLILASWDQAVRVWNADESGEPVVLRGHEDRVYWASWSPDGKRIVTASWDKTARVWSADGTGEPLVLRGHEDHLGWAAWSPDGKRIVTASDDKTARVWNASVPDEPLVLRGHEHSVVSAGFSPDGRRIVTASDDKTVRVWNASVPGEPLILAGATGGYSSAAWSPDGRSIAAASDDHTVWVWNDLEPLQDASDPKLWTATAYCMPIDVRVRILGVPGATAATDLDACLRRVDAARAAPP